MTVKGMLDWETEGNHRRKRRSVERDYAFYDSPARVFDKINSRQWPYKNNRQVQQLRDLSFMCLLYMGSFRSSELCRASLPCGPKPSVTKNQFVITKDFVKLRNIIILKRREPMLNDQGDPVYDDRGRPIYQPIQSLENYPKRKEINLPRVGDLSIFTDPVLSYLELLGPDQELYPFKYGRGYQIVNYCTSSSDQIRGEMQHYLRDQGLKLHTRLTDRNIKDLQNYSGHARIDNLVKYLGEGQLEKAYLNYKE